MERGRRPEASGRRGKIRPEVGAVKQAVSSVRSGSGVVCGAARAVPSQLHGSVRVNPVGDKWTEGSSPCRTDVEADALQMDRYFPGVWVSELGS